MGWVAVNEECNNEYWYPSILYIVVHEDWEEQFDYWVAGTGKLNDCVRLTNGTVEKIVGHRMNVYNNPIEVDDDNLMKFLTDEQIEKIYNCKFKTKRI